MSVTDKTPPTFAIGALVRVKKGVPVSNGLPLPIGGWCGKVYEASGTLYLIHWSQETLEAIRSIHRERWQGDGVDCRNVWLPEEVLEAEPGEPLCIVQMTGHPLDRVS